MELSAPEVSPNGIKTLQLGENATKERLMRFNREGMLDDYRYLLFAMHGVLQKVDKLTQPALAFSHPQQKGYLTMADVFDLKLNADLVMLSACDTGVGDPEGAGEGIRGLAGAFLYAGTSVVAVTLWSVETYSAAALSSGLFRHLRNQPSLARALQAVKREMISGQLKSPRGQSWRHPFYWSPFVLFGNAG